MAKDRPTERADLAWEDLTAPERKEVHSEFAGKLAWNWERRMFFTLWTSGKWSACATRPLFAKG